MRRPRPRPAAQHTPRPRRRWLLAAVGSPGPGAATPSPSDAALRWALRSPVPKLAAGKALILAPIAPSGGGALVAARPGLVVAGDRTAVGCWLRGIGTCVAAIGRAVVAIGLVDVGRSRVVGAAARRWRALGAL